jgi:hypothetical protein
MGDIQLTSSGLWSLLFTVLLGTVAYFLARTFKQGDKNIEEIHKAVEKLAEQVNKLSMEFLAVRTQHELAWDSHKECMKMLDKLDDFRKKLGGEEWN